MLCENCKHNEATYHSTIIINGHKASTHLCQECAEKAGFISPSRHFGLTNLFDIFEDILPYRSYMPELAMSREDDEQNQFEIPSQSRVQKESSEVENLIDLRMQLQRAIDEERYEDASVINKKIKALEKGNK